MAPRKTGRPPLNRKDAKAPSPSLPLSAVPPALSRRPQLLHRLHRLCESEGILALEVVRAPPVHVGEHLLQIRAELLHLPLQVHVFHQLLGQLVGSQRASVTTALRHIDESGLVVKRTDGTWLLLGTERFAPACGGWPCLAVVPADLSAGEAVRIGGRWLRE